MTMPESNEAPMPIVSFHHCNYLMYLAIDIVVMHLSFIFQLSYMSKDDGISLDLEKKGEFVFFLPCMYFPFADEA